jgi:hypothetical protein
MKTVKLIDQGEFKAKDVLRDVLRAAPAGGLDLVVMSQRVDLIKAVAAVGDTLTLEDAPFVALKAAIEGFRFGMADEGLLAVLTAAITPVE